MDFGPSPSHRFACLAASLPVSQRNAAAATSPVRRCSLRPRRRQVDPGIEKVATTAALGRPAGRPAWMIRTPLPFCPSIELKLTKMSLRMDSLARKRVEEDDELFLFILPALYQLCSARGPPKRARHTSRLSGKEPFPLLDAVELHDGHTADGSLNMTSLESTTSEPCVTQNGEDEYNPPYVSLDDDDDDGDDDEVMSTVKPPDQSGAATTSKRPTAANRAKEPAAVDGGKKVGKRQKKEVVLDMIEKYLQLRIKQLEGEVAEQARMAAEADDFSIEKCIGVVNTIEELCSEEKAEAFDVLKDAQNREIFMTGEPTFWPLYLGSLYMVSCTLNASYDVDGIITVLTIFWLIT
ncbi:hypothetical protein U9M48_004875, partial [Paspalum notatum var. saurae]